MLLNDRFVGLISERCTSLISFRLSGRISENQMMIFCQKVSKNSVSIKNVQSPQLKILEMERMIKFVNPLMKLFGLGRNIT